MKKLEIKTNNGKKAIMCLMLVMAFSFSHSIIMSQSLTDFNEILNQQNTSKSTNQEVIKLQSYYLDYNPVLVISEKGIKKSEKNICKVAEVSIENIEKLYLSTSEYSDVEYLKINVYESSTIQALDLSRMNSFGNLNYILFQLDYNSSARVLNSLIVNQTKKPITSYYLVSIPE